RTCVCRGDLEWLGELVAPGLTWEWWEPGPWDCHSRDEAMTVIRERIGEHAIGGLEEIIDVDEERIVVVTRRNPDSERSYEESGLPEGHDETANVVTIREGKVLAMREYRPQAEARAAAR